MHDRELRLVTMAFAAIFLGIGLTLPAEVSLTADFGVGAGGYGVLVALWGVGGLIGAWLASRLLRSWPSGPVLVVAGAGVAVGLWETGASPLFGLALATIGIAGVAEGVWQVAQQVLIQHRAPDAIRSRVLAANEAVSQAGLAIALLVAGVLVNSLGPRPVFYIAATSCAVAALVLFASSHRHRAVATPPESTTS